MTSTTLIPDGIATRKMETEYLTMWIKDGIMYAKYNEGVHIDQDVAIELVASRIYFTQAQSYPMIIDMQGVKSATREGRNYLATMGATLVTAAALITGSRMNRALGNIFLKIDKPPVPTRLFANEEKARQWLEAWL